MDLFLRVRARCRAALAAFCLLGATASAALAQEPPLHLLGWAGFGTNDWIGDGDDRWRTGSYGLTVAVGRSWDGAPPEAFGAVTEFRLHAEVIAPDRMHDPRPGDRAYAGVLSFGARSHFSRGPWEWAVGSDLVFVGPQTGLHRVHAAIHRQSGGAQPPAPGAQIGNSTHLNGTVEVGRSLEVTRGVRVRPFLGLQAGHENFVRAGVDVIVGRLGTTALMSRDPVTGLRFPVVPDREPTGLSLSLGADIAHVTDSVLLPASRGFRPTDARHRLRVGLTYDGRFGSVFAGLAWLGPEYVGQPGGQRVGAITANFRF